MINEIKKYYHKQQFEPGFLGLFINPFYIARKELLKHLYTLAPKVNGLTLDVGCGNKPYEFLFDVSKYIGLDLQTSIHNVNTFADLFYDGEQIPIKNNVIDSIVCNQVFEHVFEPNKLLSEINRVLKKDGKLIFTLPFVWDEHEQPYDYARYSSYGIHYLLKKYGFKVITSTKTAKDFSLFAQLLNLYFYKKVHKRNSIIKKVATLLIMAPITIFGLLLSKILPDNEDLYLDNVILATKENNN